MSWIDETFARIVDSSDEDCWMTHWHSPPEYHVSLVVSRFAQFNVILSGRYVSQVDGVTHVALPGDVLFYYPWQKHYDSNPLDALPTCLVLAFLWDSPPEGLPTCVVDSDGRLLSLVQGMQDARHLSRGAAWVRTYRRALLPAVVAEFLRVAESPPPPLVRQVRTFIGAHLAEPLTLERMAAEVEMNRFHFLRSFRDQAGHTPGEELRRQRVERAQELLRTTRWPVKRIALEVGLASASSLCRLFRAELGVTPAALRHGELPPGSS